MDRTNRINAGMSSPEIIAAMSDKIPGAIKCIKNILYADPRNGMKDLLFLDNLGIYGARLYKFWDECCNQEIQIFRKTIQGIRDGTLTREELNRVLRLDFAKPLI